MIAVLFVPFLYGMEMEERMARILKLWNGIVEAR
jgi:hypothetical protein